MGAMLLFHSPWAMVLSRFTSQAFLWSSVLTLAWWFLTTHIIMSGSAYPTLTEMQPVAYVEASITTARMTLKLAKVPLWALMWYSQRVGKHQEMMSVDVGSYVEVWTVLPVLHSRQLYTAMQTIVVSSRNVLDLLPPAINDFPHRPLWKIVCMISV